MKNLLYKALLVSMATIGILYSKYTYIYLQNTRTFIYKIHVHLSTKYTYIYLQDITFKLRLFSLTQQNFLLITVL